MQTVGRIGSYISKGVYTVSGTFHPFGGAVDVIVVEQPDGSYKSSPWYVRFGKFQGVLKTKEKVVGIRVNDVEADFHMHLDSNGQAFFMQEVDVEEGESEASPSFSSGEDTERPPRWPLKSKSCNYDSNLRGPLCNERMGLSRAKTQQFKFFGLFGRRPSKEEADQGKENALGFKGERSLEVAEMAADLLDLRWSTNLASSKRKKDNALPCYAADAIGKEVNKNSPVNGSSPDEISLNSLTSNQELKCAAEVNGVAMKCITSEYIDSSSVQNVGENTTLSYSEPEMTGPLGLDKSDLQTSAVSVVSEVAKSDVDIQYSIEKLNGLPTANISTLGNASDNIHSSEISGSSTAGLEGSPSSFSHEECREVCNHTEDQFTIVHGETVSVSEETYFGASERIVTKCYSQLVCHHINESSNIHSEGPVRMVRSLSSMVDFSNNVEAGDQGYFSNTSLCSGLNSRTEKNQQFPSAQQIVEVPAKPGYPSRFMDTLGASENNDSIPLRSRGIEVSDLMKAGEDLNGIESPNNSCDLKRATDVTKVKVNKKKMRTLTPTSKQLASLNLKEGKNVMGFTFSTAMLGKQRVDARIFLWRWDTKIVISDVDGTITRSDLLGQVMPLVGMDWSQTGVAHLFTAIKENGYQLLFLSARSISQSYITRQFLFNIKQDGKALPEGPVVISPDGLFPSLFREVVRRAPHEFKISCLEGIKALFPPDRNPFYAGFGNRDTDEVSYLKVGIPRGKIFIINPKGEIAVNRRVDTKSYLTLHSLVHGMFPHTCTCEQEDFNSWNYWKLPPPCIEI